MVRTDIEPATELDNRRTMSESVLFLLLLFENHSPARVGRSRYWRKPRSRQSRWGQRSSYGAAKANVQLQGHRRQRFSYSPTEPTFNYRATGGSGSHTGRQNQCSTTGPPEAAVLIQSDRANVQLQGFLTGRLCFSRALSEHTALFSALPYARGDVSVINSIFLAGGVDGTQGIEYTLCMKER